MDKEKLQKELEDAFVEMYAQGYRTGHILEVLSARYYRSVHSLYKKLKITELKKIALLNQ
jgi:hydroxymethylpyrimidine pyrophosphatase-like HAD family hydrolase